MILVMFVLFVGGGWLIGKIVGNFLFPDNEYQSTKEPTTIINHYTAENHLHITKNELKSMLEYNNSQP